MNVHIVTYIETKIVLAKCEVIRIRTGGNSS
jgi:hypothetical protein